MKYRSSRHGLLPAISLSAALLAIVFIASCQRSAVNLESSLEAAVESVRAVHAPDSRVEVFQIELDIKGERVTVSGEVSDPDLRAVVLDSLRGAAGDHRIVDSIRVLPEAQLQPKAYGIVKVSVAHMRRSPNVRAELVNQTLLGTVLKLYKEEDGFYFVHNRDRYLGWVSRSSLVAVDSMAVARWQEAPRVVCTANYGLIWNRAGSEGQVLCDLVPGVVMRMLSRAGDWVQVELPDGRRGYVQADLVMDEAALNSIRPDGDRILSVARSYLGIPYMWGGTSTKGFDCSGFVQTAFRMNNVSLPRDANQIVLEGEVVELGAALEELRAADLLFFGSSPDRITHVGICLGDQRFIHSSGSVHINSFNPEHTDYNEHLRQILQAAKRILPE